jgi:threonine dehydratase
MTLELSHIQRNRPRVDRRCHRTPIVAAATRHQQRCFWKLESLQVTGSFKVRGPLALRAVQTGSQTWVTSSAGNHGLGVAYAARGAAAPHVFVSRRSPQVKRDAIEGLGAILHLCDTPGYDATEAAARQWATQNQGCFVSPFDDPIIMAGNGGTLGCEILEQLPTLDCLVVPIGGGGLAAGIGCVVRAWRPAARLIGVQSSQTSAMFESLQRGAAILQHAGGATLAEGLEGGVSEQTFHYVQRWFDEVITVDEAAIRRAIVWLWNTLHIRVEGSAAVVAAAILEERVSSSGVLCGVLTGSNIDAPVFEELLRRGASDDL